MSSKTAKVFDWRLPFSLAFLGLVTYLVFAGLGVAQDNKEKSHRIDVLVSELQRQHSDAEAAAQIAAQERLLAAQERVTAARERARLLRGQRALERQYGVLIAKQNNLLDFLREHGVIVPERFTVYKTRTLTRYVTSPPKQQAAPTPPAGPTSPGKGGSSPGKASAGVLNDLASLLGRVLRL